MTNAEKLNELHRQFYTTTSLKKRRDLLKGIRRLEKEIENDIVKRHIDRNSNRNTNVTDDSNNRNNNSGR